jgi:hypothetical protein
VFLQIFKFAKEGWDRKINESLEKYAIASEKLLESALLSDSVESIREAMELTQIRDLPEHLEQLAKSRNNIKIHCLFGLNVTPEPSTLVDMSQSFPSFFEGIETPWGKPDTGKIRRLADLDKFILREFCCIDKKSKGGLKLKRSPNCSEDCKQ